MIDDVVRVEADVGSFLISDDEQGDKTPSYIGALSRGTVPLGTNALCDSHMGTTVSKSPKEDKAPTYSVGDLSSGRASNAVKSIRMFLLKNHMGIRRGQNSNLCWRFVPWCWLASAVE